LHRLFIACLFSDEDVRITQWPNFIVEDDILHISCAVSYSGELAPSITWSPTPDIILPLSNSSSSVNSTVQVNVPARNFTDIFSHPVQA